MRQHASRLSCPITLVLLLLCIRNASAVTIGWEFPWTDYPQVTFVLGIQTLINGVVSQREQPQPATIIAGQTLPPDHYLQIEGKVCLDDGDYTLTIYAVFVTERTVSNQLDLTVQTGTVCNPALPPVPPASTPPKKDSTPPVVIPPPPLPTSGPSLPGLPNMQCVQWIVKGPCFCNPFSACVEVEYWEPGWIVETVKVPGQTTIPLLGSILDGVLGVIGIPKWGGGGAGNAKGGSTNLQYNEAHVYTYPQLLGGPCTSCGPSSASPTPLYASELDAATWRTAVAVPSPLDILMQIGVWARLYPRGGKVIHSSEPVGSAVAAVRAMDILRQPIGTPPNLDAHVVLGHADAGVPVCIQMASPKQLPCLPGGTPNVLWEHGAVSPAGKYVWIIWRKRSCCVNANQTTCGITLPAVGKYGSNWCLLPQTPSTP